MPSKWAAIEKNDGTHSPKLLKTPSRHLFGQQFRIEVDASRAERALDENAAIRVSGKGSAKAASAQRSKLEI
ncbi:MAG TPA: hypothetical protein VMQ50_13520 [Casimicrobiaceae bacterium]|nr:hypothetical protein [Casimicrobiaceae bacterium]